MEQQNMRQAFMESTVRVVARDGVEKATTKSIAAEAKLNEAYIYKCFSGKDELLGETFLMEDERFSAFLKKTLPVICARRGCCGGSGRTFSGSGAGSISWASPTIAPFTSATIIPPAAAPMPMKCTLRAIGP